MTRKLKVLAAALVAYLLFVGLGGVAMVILNFPNNGAPMFPATGALARFQLQSGLEPRLLVLAVFAGMAGSFLHAAQSLSSYLGNATFKASWTAWYFLRPFVGGVLGFALYFAFRAGLVSGVGQAGESTIVNPYGVVALGILGGWFSKTTTDKLQEVFETLFKTDADAERNDKLQEEPVVGNGAPAPVPPKE